MQNYLKLFKIMPKKSCQLIRCSETDRVEIFCFNAFLVSGEENKKIVSNDVSDRQSLVTGCGCWTGLNNEHTDQ